MTKAHLMMAGAMALTVMSAGCATKKYVAKTVAPVETRVKDVETKEDAKNADQDKTITAQGQQLQEVSTDLSRTKERLTDTDAKAVQAGQAAQQANQAAQDANSAAGRAQQSADSARTFADQGITRLERTIDASNKFQMVKNATVLFGVNQFALTKEDKESLDDFAKQAEGLPRYVIEIQGFTDKTGPAVYNEQLSEKRADEVARYLAVQHMIPVRDITTLGLGYAEPVADDKTRDGRKQNRRVEVRLYVPETASAPVAQAQQ